MKIRLIFTVLELVLALQFKKFLSRVAMALVFVSTPISFSIAAETFVFTAIPDEDESRLRQRFEKVADYLGRQLDVSVRYIPVKSYAAAITAFRNDQVQMAWFGGLSGVRARNLVPGSQAIAQGFEDQAFITYFIATKTDFFKNLGGRLTQIFANIKFRHQAPGG